MNITTIIQLVYLIIICNALRNCGIGPVVREGAQLTLCLERNSLYCPKHDPGQDYRVRQLSPVKLALKLNGFPANVTPGGAQTCTTFRAGYQAIIYLADKTVQFNSKLKKKRLKKIKMLTLFSWSCSWNDLTRFCSLKRAS